MSRETIEKLAALPSEDIAIELSHVTKDYGKGRGIFDVSLRIPRGCTFGYCGTNGAGKTTTMRHVMGFIRPDKGRVTVNGLDPYKDGETIKKDIGYCPGEIAFPALNSGSDFLRLQAQFLGLEDLSKAESIIKKLQLDPTANLRRMSKGMKQKTALVATFMHSPRLILLDEPTTGLDPLMREAFLDVLEDEKAAGATIFMSNHMFDELEETCDYVAFIAEGKIVDVVAMEEIHNRPFREYVATFFDGKDALSAFAEGFDVQSRSEEEKTVHLRVEKDKGYEPFFKELGKYRVKSVNEVRFTLERYFMETLGGKNHDADD